MEKIVYKPYKKKLNTWIHVKDKQRASEDGRTIVCIEIGKKQYIEQNNNEVVKEEYEQEEIYFDILKGLFTNTVSYSTQVTLGHEPKLVISYDDCLVRHNDKIQTYVDKIRQAFSAAENRILFKCLFNVVMNEKEGEKYSAEFKQFCSNINKICTADYPPELIALVLKEYLSAEHRSMDKLQEKTHMMEYKELMTLALKVIVTRDVKAEVKKYEDVLKEELLYRFILGEIS